MASDQERLAEWLEPSTRWTYVSEEVESTNWSNQSWREQYLGQHSGALDMHYMGDEAQGGGKVKVSFACRN